MKQFFRNIFYLGVKEIRGLLRDPLMVLLVLYVFTVGVYSAAKATPDTISNAVVAVVDEDQSTLSHRISDAFQPPLFKRISNVRLDQVDPGMDRGLYTFVVVIPVGFQRDVLSGKEPAIQLNVDATRMSQAFTGSGYLQNIIDKEIRTYINKGSTFKDPTRTREVPFQHFVHDVLGQKEGKDAERFRKAKLDRQIGQAQKEGKPGQRGVERGDHRRTAKGYHFFCGSHNISP